LGLVEAPSIADFGLRTADCCRLRIADCGFAVRCLVAVALAFVTGCHTTPAPAARAKIVWQTDLALALDDARRTGRPIFVLAVIGDIDRQC